jgi:hypothetical protein
LVAASVPPSDLMLLGPVRHLTGMERVHLAQPLRGPPELIYCTNEQPDADLTGLTPSMVACSANALPAPSASERRARSSQSGRRCESVSLEDAR